MFPFGPDQFAPLDRWYVAAFSSQVGRAPVERWICDEPVAMYRRADGSAVAVDGRCPHHMFPLAQGTVVGDDIRCGYHGLTFSPEGACVASPFLTRIPAACRIRSYPVAERWQWIWIWPGDPAAADEALIPDHAAIGLDDPEYHAMCGLHHEIAARYQLLNDNLLDLQHLEVLHGAHIGSEGFGLFEEMTESGEDWVYSRRELREVAIPPVMQTWFGAGAADRLVDMRFLAPGLHVGTDVFTGAAGGARAGQHLGRINVYHAVTPARRGTCHYFTAMGRDFAMGDAGFDAGMRHKLSEVLSEDIGAAEGVERMLVQSASVREMLFRTDANLVAGRRVLQRMMEREARAAAGGHAAAGRLAAAFGQEPA